ncbi:MAG TPA: hypothetical protein VKG78_01880, partial [Opitutaceae bacterium]|nr:hypothetical protein [Opitutaceae bacterium]
MRRALLVGISALVALAAACRSGLAHAPRARRADEPLATQRESKGPPPAAPGALDVDPGAPLPPPRAPVGPPDLRLRRIPEGRDGPAPGRFNPDPGAWIAPSAAPETPLFSTFRADEPAAPEQPPGPTSRGPLERAAIEPAPAALPSGYGSEPVPDPLKLPRAGVRENRSIPSSWAAPDKYPPGEPGGSFPGSLKVPDRWRVGFVPWRRYTSGDTEEMPYYYSDPEFWHYYRQSTLKGDLPIRGQDVFLRLTASASVVAEDRRLPVPSGDSAARSGSFDFFGESQSQFVTSDLAFEADLFKGDTVFKPVEWLVHIKPVVDFNHVNFRETGLVSPDPRGTLTSGIGGEPANSGVNNPSDVGSLLSGGLAQAPANLGGTDATSRNKAYLALQEAFVEWHLADLSPSYDFCAVEVGNQTFNSDFRGFVFNDTNLGARFFGNYDSNRWQYNVALFDLREKDTNSGLNSFNRRGQVVAIANLYRQDTFMPGFTTELSVLASFDQPGTHYDKNGFIVRPAPVGTVVPHRVNSYYIGWTGDGHLGRWNVTDAVYLATGHDELNPIAGRPVDILAEMAALEVSYDRDWLRYKASVFFASGDHDSRNGLATGFDSIADNTNFTGGPFSYWVRQSFNLAGTSLPIKQRFSLLPDLRAGGNFEGQSNFVNPGLALVGLGAEADLTPKLRAFANANYLWFDTTDPIKTLLITNQAGRNIGADLSLGFQWRPFLISNVVISAGCGVLLPGGGYRDIYA